MSDLVMPFKHNCPKCGVEIKSNVELTPDFPCYKCWEKTK